MKIFGIILKGEMSGRIKLFIPLVLIFLIIILQNVGMVTLRLFFWKIDISTIILVPVLIAMGVFIGFILGKSKWSY